MTLTLIYKSKKTGHLYKKNFRSYVDLDKFSVQIRKKGYEIVGGGFGE